MNSSGAYVVPYWQLLYHQKAIYTNKNLLKGAPLLFYQDCITSDGKHDGQYVRTLFGAIFLSLSNSKMVQKYSVL
jgi:hypothetical protein